MTNTDKIGPTIALCVIAKNEADMIGDCIDSAREFVDEIVVVDTGSTDRTVEIAREHGARVEHFEWINDFAAARNYAIDQATTDWILMLDADERLVAESGPLLRRVTTADLPAGFFGVCVQIDNRVQGRSLAHFMTRLFPRRAELRFEGAIHEELRCHTPELGNMVLIAPEIKLVHHGYEPELYAARNKDERNMRLLEADLEQHPDNARLLYYVLQQHCALLRYESALPYVERFMANKGQLRRDFEVEVTRMWLEALLGLGRDDDAARVLAEAEKADVVSSYAYDMIANRELRANHTAAALELLLKARNPKLPTGLWGHLSGSQWQQWTRIADCQWSLGHYKRALAELEQAITLVPEDQRRNLSLTVFDRCVEAHQDTAAYRWAAHAHEHSGDDLDQHFEVVDRVFALPGQASRKGVYAALDGAVARQNWQRVYDEATRLPLDDMSGLARVLRVSQRFVDEGAADAALDLLNRAIDAFPREPRVYWSLVRALNALGRHADAADALAVLESLNSEAPVLKAA